jgi:hypothetical protein
MILAPWLRGWLSWEGLIGSEELRWVAIALPVRNDEIPVDYVEAEAIRGSEIFREAIRERTPRSRELLRR